MALRYFTIQRGLLLGLVALVAALSAAPAASAGTRSATITLSHKSESGSVTATCPRGQRATGGGFTVAPPSSPSGGVIPYESQKVGQRSWRVTAQEGSSSPTGIPAAVSAFAYCRKHAPKTKVVSVSISTPDAPSGELHRVDASCKSGRAEAGGFLSPVGGNIQQLESFRVDKGTWRNSFITASPGTGVTTYVYCAKTKLKARVGTASITTIMNPPPVLSAPCKKGASALAGGFAQPDISVPGKYTTGPEQLFRSGKSFQIALGYHVGTATSLQAIAYCG